MKYSLLRNFLTRRDEGPLRTVVPVQEDEEGEE
jgi:hypothetical protein